MVLHYSNLLLDDFATGQQSPPLLAGAGLNVNRSVEADPHHLCDAAGIVAVRLVHLSGESGFHVPRLGTDRWESGLDQCAEQPLGQWASLEADTVKRESAI